MPYPRNKKKMKKMLILSAVVTAVVLMLLFVGKEISNPDYAELYQCSLIGSGIAAFAVSIQRHLHNPRIVIATFFGGLIPCLFAWQTIVVYIVGVVVLSVINRGETWKQVNDFCQE